MSAPLSCAEAAGLSVARSLEVLEEGELPALVAHLEACSSCPARDLDVATAFEAIAAEPVLAPADSWARIRAGIARERTEAQARERAASKAFVPEPAPVKLPPRAASPGVIFAVLASTAALGGAAASVAITLGRAPAAASPPPAVAPDPADRATLDADLARARARYDAGDVGAALAFLDDARADAARVGVAGVTSVAEARKAWGSIAALFWEGRLAEAAGDGQRARDLYARIQELEPGEGNRFHALASARRRALDASPFTLEEGRLALASGDIATALAAFSRARTSAERDAIAQLVLEAKKDRRLALPEKDPPAADASPTMLEKLVLLSTFLPPGDATGERARRLFQEARGRLTGALPGGILATPVDGGPVEAQSLLELAFAQLEAERMDEAEATVRRAVEIDPTRVTAYVYLAWIASRRGDPARAIEHLSRAIALDPMRPDLYGRRAMIHLREGQLDSAVMDASHAIELDPVETAPWLVRSQAYLSLGRLDQALRDVERVLAIEPRHAYAIGLRGIVRLQRGDRTEARRDLERALQLLDPASGNTATLRKALAALDAQEAKPGEK